MRAGRLRHRITLQAATETRDSRGGVARAWGKKYKRWASVEPLTGKEFMDALQVDANISHRVRLRHVDGITTSWRIQHDGRTLNIESIINPQDRDKELELMCMEDTRGVGS